MIIKKIDIDGFTSDCCMAPIYNGRCMKCGETAKPQKLVIRGIYMAQKPLYRAILQSLIPWWPLIIGGIIGLLIGYQLVSYCGK